MGQGYLENKFEEVETKLSRLEERVNILVSLFGHLLAGRKVNVSCFKDKKGKWHFCREEPVEGVFVRSDGDNVWVLLGGVEYEASWEDVRFS